MATDILYPALFELKLATNREMRGAVDTTITQFEFWLRDSKLPFFPDYTDHGPDHLTEVLKTAAQIIRRDAEEYFSAEDAAVLILAVLLHDAALHLSEDGFRELVSGRAAHNRIETLDTESWPELWQSFLFASRHWNDRKLIEVFGKAGQDIPISGIRDPLVHQRNLTEIDRKLIGEFIRQHHPRMAHEFAVFGVPGPSNDPIRPSPAFGAEKIDIAGLVARSHGLPARACLDYISDQYDRRQYQNVHAVFLMTVLRVADYLQIQSGRSSPVIPRYKRIVSPRSELEHKAHRAIRNVSPYHDDPEAWNVQALPEDVEVFLHLKALLAGLQEELDASWAVLGEVYGSDPRLSKLGLSIRRVHSNLDDVRTFARRVSYFPERVEFDVAHAEVMKLLVKPLYGNKPEIGIRELMQNAIDAVRELQAWLHRHPDYPEIQLTEQEGDVEIWLDTSESGDETGPIELRYDGNLKVGTTIRVRLRPFYLGDDDWDWYCFEKPVVRRRKGPAKTILPQRSVLPDEPDRLPIGWYKVQSFGFSAILIGTSTLSAKVPPSSATG